MTKKRTKRRRVRWRRTEITLCRAIGRVLRDRRSRTLFLNGSTAAAHDKQSWAAMIHCVPVVASASACLLWEVVDHDPTASRLEL